MKTILFFSLVLSVLALAGPNGPYGAPSEASYRALTTKERALYEARLADLLHPEFVSKSHYKSPSFYLTPAGQGELKKIAMELAGMLDGYDRFVSIGRSGTGLLQFLRGYYTGSAKLDDMPFSYGDVWTKVSDEERAGLRAHLERNGLDPKSIAGSAKPLLFFDFAYSGQGSAKLLEEIHAWAKELGLDEAVKKKTHFYGCFPAEMIAHQQVMSIYYATMKEMPGLRGTPPTEAEIREEARNVDLPGRHRFEAVASKIHQKRISSAFYNYAGTHGPNAHESLVRAKWTVIASSLPENGFAGHSDDKGYQELFFLRRDGELFRQSCPAALGK